MAKYLIVGGVAGGATVAARLRRVDEKSEIVLFERGEYISYANCGLPYYIGDTINEREKLFVQTPESFYARFKVDVRTNNEVLSIDRKKKSVEVKNLKTNETYTESYDKLVLSPGANPIKPPIPGIDSENIFILRNVPDTDQIKTYVTEQKPQRAVIVGAGFIGLEMAENLHHLGIMTTIVEMADQVMNVLDFEMAAEVHQHLKTKNVEFYLKDGVAAFSKDKNGKIVVKLNSGKEIHTDMVVLSIGVKPELDLPKGAGLDCGKFGMLTNEYLQTNDPDIYALGDAVEVLNPLIGKSMIIPLAGPANKQGRIVADNMVFGNKRTYKGTIGTAIAKVFDLTVGSTGASEKILKRENIPYIANITHGSSHAGYYPDALPLSLKLIVSPDTGKVLGAQVVGYEGVDKRIDVIASFIKCGMTIYDLQEMEHAYAPPFSSAKDPANIAAFSMENIINGTVKVVHWHELDDMKNNALLVDVRTADEFALGTIEGAVNIPVDNLRDKLDDIPKNKKVIIFCGVGLRGYVACRILYQNGFDDVYNLSGGYKTYEHVSQKQSNEDIFGKDFIGNDDMIYQSDPDKKGDSKIIQVDACGLQCPGPIMKLKNEMANLQRGDILKITASDPGFFKDVKAWSEVTGNMLLSVNSEKGKIYAEIEKGHGAAVKSNSHGSDLTHNKTLVVFSDDFDRALASFVIANGALSMGKEVTMFFTFWGLNIIKKNRKPRGVKKDFMGKMFGMMLPDNSKKLKMSKMNMNGLGTSMMRSRMKSKGVDSLELMISQALEAGVKLVACQMSMDMMGVDEKELIDGVVVGGVATYLQEADKSNMNLFI